MVSRKLNEPIKGPGFLAKQSAPFWLKEVGTTWWCRGCGVNCPPSKIAFEYCSKKEVTEKKLQTVVCPHCTRAQEMVPSCNHKYVAVNNYLCEKCADEFLTRAKDKMALISSVGKEAYVMVNKL